MVFSVAAATARRQIAVMARKHMTQQVSQAQRRAMGGGHAPAPEWEGIDKVVRGVFPADYQREFRCERRSPLIFVIVGSARDSKFLATTKNVH